MLKDNLSSGLQLCTICSTTSVITAGVISTLIPLWWISHEILYPESASSLIIGDFNSHAVLSICSRHCFSIAKRRTALVICNRIISSWINEVTLYSQVLYLFHINWQSIIVPLLLPFGTFDWHLLVIL